MLPDRDFRLKMTSSYYYTPSGRNLSRRMRRDGDPDDPGGVNPDRAVPMTPDDVKRVAHGVLRHRIALTADLEIEGQRTDEIISALLEDVDAPRL